MQQLHTVYLQLLKNICTSAADSASFSVKDSSALYHLAEKHCSLPFLLPYLKEPELSIAKQKTKQMMLSYYQMEHFTEKTISLLTEQQISCYLLKGISLASYYPVPEYRKLGDLDLYLPNASDFAKAREILQQNGYLLQDELSDHHETYLYRFPSTGRTCMLELHYRIVGIYQFARANELVDQIFSESHLKPAFQTINGKSYQVLPPTEYVFYMMHHMLKHYLYNGFGIRLLCDFTQYVNAHVSEIDFSRIRSWCSDSKILHLYELIVQSCKTYLGLHPNADPSVHCTPSECDIFLEKVLSDGDFGTASASSLVNSSSYRHAGPLAYFLEGHTQMKVRFPRLSKCPLFWPFLWIAAFVIFLSNTYRIRHTTLRQTLADFKAENQRTKLLKIFDNSDSAKS